MVSISYLYLWKKLFLNVFIFIDECSIPKLFHKNNIIVPMKLTKSKLIETLRKLNNRKTVYQARKIASISVRRVYQVKGILVFLLHLKLSPNLLLTDEKTASIFDH